MFGDFNNLPYTAKISSIIKFHYYIRFPLKQQCLLEQQEPVIQKVHKDGKHWRATRHSYICSKHFDVQDYQELPSSSGKCPLKHGAVPSIFSTAVDENYNTPKETQHS